MRRFILKCKKEVFFFMVANLVWAGIGISLAYLLGLIADTAINRIAARMITISILTIIYLVLDTVFEFASSYTEIILRTKISLLMRNALIKRIQNCRIEEKEKMGDAHFLSILNNNVAEVETEYVHGMLVVVFQIFSLIFAIIATTLIQPLMTIIVIILCIVPIFVPRMFKNKLEKANRESIAAKSSYLNFLNELMEGFAAIQVFGRSDEVGKFHERINDDTTKKIQSNFKWKRISMSLSYGLGNVVVIGGWVFGAIFALTGSITFPQIVALTTLMNMVAGPFQIISEYYAGIISGHAIASDLMQFIDSDAGTRTYKSYDCHIESIELKGVSALRDGHYIINEVDFRAQSGQKICVIGKSGSGKSSLLKVIAGIMEIQGGGLWLNDSLLVDKHSLTHQDLLLLPQNSVLFSATIKDNITLFKDFPTHVVEEVIRSAGLTDWFRNVGGDINKSFKKSSVNLSGGEQRRIEFARMLIEKAQILLFDEPTAGLDASSAKNIMNQICSMMNKLIIVATHDIDEENLLRFDHVYMLENGKIAAHDTPANMIHDSKYISLKHGDEILNAQ